MFGPLGLPGGPWLVIRVTSTNKRTRNVAPHLLRWTEGLKFIKGPSHAIDVSLVQMSVLQIEMWFQSGPPVRRHAHSEMLNTPIFLAQAAGFALTLSLVLYPACDAFSVASIAARSSWIAQRAALSCGRVAASKRAQPASCATSMRGGTFGADSDEAAKSAINMYSGVMESHDMSNLKKLEFDMVATTA